MLPVAETSALIGILAGLSIYLTADRLLGRRRHGFHLPGALYLRLTWPLFLCFVIADLAHRAAALWVLALISFWALREYFSLVEIRLQDRLGILGSYLAIPFMIAFIQEPWYGMFIVSIPVYAFLAVLLLVTVGGPQKRGTVVSVGTITFGLFLCVYCLGHLGYLMVYGPWMAAMLVLSVAACDGLEHGLQHRWRVPWPGLCLRFVLALPVTVGINLLLGPWTGIPPIHGLGLGILIPLLVIAGRHTSDHVRADLGIDAGEVGPPRGEVIGRLASLLYTGPVVFHYVRYFLK